VPPLFRILKSDQKPQHGTATVACTRMLLVANMDHIQSLLQINYETVIKNS
jgi:hypothetical protein